MHVKAIVTNIPQPPPPSPQSPPSPPPPPVYNPNHGSSVFATLTGNVTEKRIRVKMEEVGSYTMCMQLSSNNTVIQQHVHVKANVLVAPPPPPSLSMDLNYSMSNTENNVVNLFVNTNYEFHFSSQEINDGELVFLDYDDSCSNIPDPPSPQR